MKDELKTLKRITWFVLAFLGGVCGISAALVYQNPITWQATRLNSFIGLLGTVVFAIVLPIVLRLHFFRKRIKEKGLRSISQFIRMKTISLAVVSGGCLFALYSSVVPIFRYHLYLAVLAALYGIYTVLPFDENLSRDLTAFGVVDETV